MEYRIILLEKDGLPIPRQPYRVEKLIITTFLGIVISKEWEEINNWKGLRFSGKRCFKTYEDAEKYITYTLKNIDTPITRKVVTE